MSNSPNSRLSISGKSPARKKRTLRKSSDPEGTVFWARLAVPSKIKAINPNQKLKRMLRAACLAPGHTYAVETALREALANAIVAAPPERQR